MRLDRYFAEVEGPASGRARMSAPVSLASFCPAGFGPAAQWAEVYRRAYLQAVEALRPTGYDRAMAASAN